ncbi:hypothetical protein ACP70R_042995 [Stipagrostis hirtigluma subsp. patula]
MGCFVTVDNVPAHDFDESADPFYRRWVAGGDRQKLACRRVTLQGGSAHLLAARKVATHAAGFALLLPARKEATGAGLPAALLPDPKRTPAAAGSSALFVDPKTSEDRDARRRVLCPSPFFESSDGSSQDGGSSVDAGGSSEDAGSTEDGVSSEDAGLSLEDAGGCSAEDGGSPSSSEVFVNKVDGTKVPCIEVSSSSSDGRSNHSSMRRPRRGTTSSSQRTKFYLMTWPTSYEAYALYNQALKVNDDLANKLAIEQERSSSLAAELGKEKKKSNSLRSELAQVEKKLRIPPMKMGTHKMMGAP